MPASKATQCKQCGTLRENTSKMVGLLCYECYKDQQNRYYAENKRKVLDKQREHYIKKQITINPNYLEEKAIRDAKPKKDRKGYSKRYYEANKNKVQHKNRMAHQCKRALERNRRKPLKARRDFETYTDNNTWLIQHTMFLDFDMIKDCPIEHLTYEYWKNEQEELLKSVEKHAKSYKGYMDYNTGEFKEQSSYLKKDLEYGEYIDKDGNKKIRFYPT